MSLEVVWRRARMWTAEKQETKEEKRTMQLWGCPGIARANSCRAWCRPEQKVR